MLLVKNTKGPPRSMSQAATPQGSI